MAQRKGDLRNVCTIMCTLSTCTELCLRAFVGVCLCMCVCACCGCVFFEVCKCFFLLGFCVRLGP